jgi:predicted HicB family RNase H-like nuclease
VLKSGYYGAKKVAVTIRIDPEAHIEAKVAAVRARQPLGDWLSEAIREKIERDNHGNA